MPTKSYGIAKHSLHNWKSTHILFIGQPQYSHLTHLMSCHPVIFRSIAMKTFYIRLQSSFYGILCFDDFEIGCRAFSSLFEMCNWIKSIDNCNPRACIAVVFYRFCSHIHHVFSCKTFCTIYQAPYFNIIN